MNGKTQLSETNDTGTRTRSTTDGQGRITLVTLDEFDNTVKTDYPDGASTSPVRCRRSSASSPR